MAWILSCYQVNPLVLSTVNMDASHTTLPRSSSCLPGLVTVQLELENTIGNQLSKSKESRWIRNFVCNACNRVTIMSS